FDRHVGVFDIARLLKSLPKSAQRLRESVGRLAVEEPDHRDRRLLRARRDWPRCRSAYQRDELAPPDHSITSSAVGEQRKWNFQASRRTPAAEQRDELAAFHSMISSAADTIAGGISRLSVFAFLRLMTNSILVGSMTGRSPGFSPFRIRPV